MTPYRMWLCAEHFRELVDREAVLDVHGPATGSTCEVFAVDREASDQAGSVRGERCTTTARILGVLRSDRLAGFGFQTDAGHVVVFDDER